MPRRIVTLSHIRCFTPLHPHRPRRREAAKFNKRTIRLKVDGLLAIRYLAEDIDLLVEIEVFSIRTLLSAVGLCAFAVATLAAASPFILGIVTTLVLIALIIASAVCVLATGARRQFWLIFVATIWAYLVFEYGIMHNARLMFAGEFPGYPSPVPRLVPSDWLLGKFFEIMPSKEIGTFDPFGTGMDIPITRPDEWSFFHMGRFHFAWILGLFTAQTSLLVHRVLNRQREGTS